MKLFLIIMTIITILLSLSTGICGLWIRGNHVTDASSLSFHMTIGISTILFTLVTITLLILRIK